MKVDSKKWMMGILVGILGISILVENARWYLNLNGYGIKEVLYGSGLLESPSFAESNSELYAIEKSQIVLIKVLGHHGNYQWAYRYSLLPGILPTWPFVTTLVTSKSTVKEYLNRTLLDPNVVNDPFGDLEIAQKNKVACSELFKIMSDNNIVVSVGFWMFLLLGFFYLGYDLVKTLLGKESSRSSLLNTVSS